MGGCDGAGADDWFGLRLGGGRWFFLNRGGRWGW